MYFKPIQSTSDAAGSGFPGAVSAQIPFKSSHLTGSNSPPTSPAALGGGNHDTRLIPVIGWVTVVVDTSSVTATGGATFAIEVYDKTTGMVIWTAMETVDNLKLQTLHTYFEGGMAVLPLSAGGIGHPSQGVWDTQAIPAYNPAIRAYPTEDLTALVATVSLGVTHTTASQLH